MARTSRQPGLHGTHVTSTRSSWYTRHVNQVFMACTSRQPSVGYCSQHNHHVSQVFMALCVHVKINTLRLNLFVFGSCFRMLAVLFLVSSLFLSVIIMIILLSLSPTRLYPDLPSSGVVLPSVEAGAATANSSLEMASKHFLR